MDLQIVLFAELDDDRRVETPSSIGLTLPSRMAVGTFRYLDDRSPPEVIPSGRELLARQLRVVGRRYAQCLLPALSAAGVDADPKDLERRTFSVEFLEGN